MCKKLIFAFLVFFSTLACASSEKSNQILLDVNFDWRHAQEKNSHNQFITDMHVQKAITLNPQQKNYQIAFTQSEIINKTPVTLAVLVKPIQVTSQTAEFQFEVLEYRFSGESSTLWTQPRIIVSNGQSAQLSISSPHNPQLNLKVTGKWV